MNLCDWAPVAVAQHIHRPRDAIPPPLRARGLIFPRTPDADTRISVTQALETLKALVHVPYRGAYPRLSLPRPLLKHGVVLSFAAVDDIRDHGKIKTR
jgi:hypothetical protein